MTSKSQPVKQSNSMKFRGSEIIQRIKELFGSCSISWKQAFVLGFMTVLFGALSTAVAIYLNACSATFTDAVGLTKDLSDEDNLTPCLLAGALLAVIAYFGFTVSIYGIAAAWFYSSDSVTALTPEEKLGLSGSIGTIYTQDNAVAQKVDLRGFMKCGFVVIVLGYVFFYTRMATELLLMKFFSPMLYGKRN